MNTFDDVHAVESVCWQMRLADYPRSTNRTLVNDEFDGLPPYTDEGERENNIAVNVNPLSGTRIMHVARQQGYQSFMGQSRFFTAKTNSGKVPRHKRDDVNTTVSGHVNRIMKRNHSYFEKMRSTVASTLLHGVGPGTWDDRWKWCPRMMGMEDVYLPSNTRLEMDNVPFMAIYRSYTGAQLRKLTSGPKVDPGWNMEAVNYMIEWVDKEAQSLLGSTWPEVWSPEKTGQRIKGDGGFYSSDAIPTIDAYDFVFWSDEGKQSGWRRRIVLDTYGSPGVAGVTPKGKPNYSAPRGDRRYGEGKGFLYNSNDRVYASKLSEISSFQFGDLSAVAPFKYHTVRGLGFLIWAVCKLQDRLYCAGMEATFEELMQYFRVKSMADVEQTIALRLVNRAFLDESTQFIGKDQRWQTNLALLEYAYGQNDQNLRESAGAFAQRQDYSEQKERKTKFQVMAEVNAASTLVSTGLLQAYAYQSFEFREIFRRFCQKNSRDPEVREFRLACLRDGVPEEVLVPEAWEISTEQILGAGNKTMAMTIAQQLMEMRSMFDPEPQRRILHKATLAITDDAALADELVPDEPVKVSDSVHDAQLSFGTLMMGGRMDVKTGINHVETIETLLLSMAEVIKRIEESGGMADQKEIIGLQKVAKYISENIQILAQDRNEKSRVKKYGDELGQLLNHVKSYSQRLMEAQQKAQQQNGGLDAEAAAKLKGKMLMDQAKAANMRESHGARTSQKQISFEMKQRQDAERHTQAMQQKAQDDALDLHRKLAETAIDLQSESAKSKMRSKPE